MSSDTRPRMSNQTPAVIRSPNNTLVVILSEAKNLDITPAPILSGFVAKLLRTT